MPELLDADDPVALARAADLIRVGIPVAVPTETVYGLAADACNGEAVGRIYAGKGRPSFNPLIVHVSDIAMAIELADLNGAARSLAEAFWPGPLTLVLPLRAGAGIASIVVAGLSTVALRVPRSPAMQALIAATRRPLAAPSANRSGGISPTLAAHVAASLGERVALVLDGGPTAHGLESTIVRPDTDRLLLLRPGPVTAGQLTRACGLPVQAATDGVVSAPGQLAAHYAPRKPLRLDVTAAAPDEWLIGFGPIAGDATLSASGSLIEAAAALFAGLHVADAAAPPRIAVAPIPGGGLGAAIRDRLARASVGSGAVGSGAVGSGAVGSGAVGSGAVGSGAVGSGAAGSGAAGSGAAGSGAAVR